MIRVLLLLACVPCSSLQAEEQTFLNEMIHLRNGGEREWQEFPAEETATEWRHRFTTKANPEPMTLEVQQEDVKQIWKVSLNGKEIARLHRDENAMTVYFPVPAGALVDGGNELRIHTTSRDADDIRIGRMKLHDRPAEVLLTRAALQVYVTDEAGKAFPCRITVLNQQGALQQVGSQSSDTRAVRPGVIYSADGSENLGLPAGTYTIMVGRGPEYQQQQTTLTLTAGRWKELQFQLRRVVDTSGWVACDTHIHTVTHSGHGDCSMSERMITLAGECIELPIATDHNKHIDYDSTATALQLRRYFTPVIGNEVTTKIGHFNVFPIRAGAAIPNHQSTDWPALFQSISQTPDVRVMILNHPRDLHSNYRPFGPKHHISIVGENLDGWNLQANAVEVVNSAAMQTDIMQQFHDWLGMLNRGRFLTPVGSSDSHDVSRYIVGQGRTYIRVKDDDVQNIAVNDAVQHFVAGRVSVSLGLFTTITVNKKYGPGDLVPADKTRTVDVQVKVQGPEWIRANVVELYVNGVKTKSLAIPEAQQRQPGIKWEGGWTLKNLSHDVHLVAVARGPDVGSLSWPIGKPYQPDSPIVNSQVIGFTGAVWLDVNNDGKRTTAHDYAHHLLKLTGHDPVKVIPLLADYDLPTAAHVAHQLRLKGHSLTDPKFLKRAMTAGEPVLDGFQIYHDQWQQSQRARALP